MPPIFTDQYRHEQELHEKNCVIEAERQQCAKLSKQGIVVYAWTEVHFCLPPTVQELQEGFMWPYLVLSGDVLSDLGLNGLHVQLYRWDLGTWLNIKVEHQITVKERDHIFLKACNVKSYQDFDEHLEAGSHP
ncbi:hypothetical protein L208DRAFT_1263198 [Tricholoma matsutake]|nr:hypothetical protein L208DRAFT_1263198 [Tricholoma matsutake 945]